MTCVVGPDEEILVLTPLVNPLAASASSHALSECIADSPAPDHHRWDRAASVLRGEEVFRELGRSMARQKHGRVLHTSYTASGVRPVHENLIYRASAVIILTADANRNLYQSGFTKHVSMICKTQQTTDLSEKPCIVVSVSSPYDFVLDAAAIGTYICTYDFTETALISLVGVLYGDLSPTGRLPGSMTNTHGLHHSRQHWLVEAFNEERDSEALDDLLDALKLGPSTQQELSEVSTTTFSLRRPEVTESHLVVRDSSTHEVHGFCATYYFKSTGAGVISTLVVNPRRRNLSIGASLHNRAIRTLLQQEGIKRFQIGSRLPSVYLGIPLGRGAESRRLKSWFANLGWGIGKLATPG